MNRAHLAHAAIALLVVAYAVIAITLAALLRGPSKEQP